MTRTGPTRAARAVPWVIGLVVVLGLLTGGVTAQTETTTSGGDMGADEPQGLFAMWQSYSVFVAFVTLAFAAIGMWSKALTLGAWGGYLAFLYIAFTTGTPLYENIALVTLVLVFLGFAFKLVRLEFGAE